MRCVEGDDFLDDRFVLASRMSRKNRYAKFKLDPYSEGIVLGSGPNTHTPPNVVVSEITPIREYPNLLGLQERVGGNYGLLVAQFIEGNGPESIYARLRKKRKVREEDFRPGENDPGSTGLSLATGVVFERLAYSWLKGLKIEGEGYLLDTGSCKRIFNKLQSAYTAQGFPDGLHFTMRQEDPIIDALFEYQTNPSRDTSINKVRDIAKFVSEFSGRTIRLSSPVIFDRKTLITASQITVAENAETFLVVPVNYDRQEVDDRVQVIKTPFSPRFVSMVTHATLHDLGFERQ